MIDIKPEFYDIRREVDFKKYVIAILIGGRGIGKTYSTLDMLYEYRMFHVKQGNETGKFIYVRNTDKQLLKCRSDLGNPFKAWNLDHGRSVQFVPCDDDFLIVEKNGNDTIDLGYAFSLSTCQNIRGTSFPDVDFVVLDEFIQKRKLTYPQFENFIDLYETVNRNRELFGEPPVKAVLLSNSQHLGNDILDGFNLIQKIEKIKREKGSGSFHVKQLYCSILPDDNEITNAKRNTAMMNIIDGTKIASEFLDNDFSHDSFYNIARRPVKEYVPVCSIDDIYIYRHKTNGSYYACESRHQRDPYTSLDTLPAFRKKYMAVFRERAIRGKMVYENYRVKNALEKILKIV